MEKRIQFRGVCCVCGKLHATKDGMLVNHGYSVEWGTFNGVCFGANKPHYGHVNAPKFIKSFIEILKGDLAALPSIIENREAQLAKQEQAKKALEDSGLTYSAKAVREASKDIANSRKILAGLKLSLNGGLKNYIDLITKNLKNWVESATVEVDLVIEAAELRAEKKAQALVKKQEKDAKNAAKEERKKQAEEKAAAKLAAILSADAYHRIYFNGELLIEWQGAYSSDGAMFDDVNTRQRKHFIENGGEDYAWDGARRYVHEVRTMPEGKGRLLYR
jgi:hypothetical protein